MLAEGSVRAPQQVRRSKRQLRRLAGVAANDSAFNPETEVRCDSAISAIHHPSPKVQESQRGASLPRKLRQRSAIRSLRVASDGRKANVCFAESVADHG